MEGYRGNPGARARLDGIAAALDAAVVDEDSPARLEAVVRGAIGTGPVRAVRERRSTVALAPLALAGSLVPLALLVGRRNRV